jgi:tetratricopeptide (TPR) repeat protein
VDPQTKLPITIGDSELSYEEPPAGTFEITTPPGYVAVDKRPGAVTGPVPDWLAAEENATEKRGDSFDKGTQALVQVNYAEAAKQFEQALGGDSWATFWLGSAYYGLGQYDQAVKYYGQMLKDFGGDKKPVPFCNYARGLAYARSGNLKAAETDFRAALPAMIQTLRIPSGGKMFEYADNPLIRYGKHKPTDQEMVVKMINRLRIISGQSFGYNPGATPQQNEVAIAAWEEWFKDGGQIKFTPEAKLLPVPGGDKP